MPAEESTEEVLDGEEYPDGKERISLGLHILDRKSSNQKRGGGTATGLALPQVCL